MSEPYVEKRQRSAHIKAIEILGHLGNDAIPALGEIALKGFSYSERIKGIEILGQINDDQSFNQLSEVALNATTYTERQKAMDLLKRHLK